MALLKRSCYILWAIGAWIIFALVDFFVPAASIFSKSLEVWMMVISYIGIMAFVAFLAQSYFMNQSNESFTDDLTQTHLSFIIWTSMTFSLIGLVLLFYDRVFIQQIDYSSGVAFARQQWLRQGEIRNGVSSIFSVLGNIGTPFVFVALNMLQLHWERVDVGLRKLLLILGLFIILGHSQLNGGRTIILMYITTTLSVAIIRQVCEKKVFSNINWQSLCRIVLLLAILISFSTYIVEQRVEMNNLDAKGYAIAIIDGLSGYTTGSFELISEIREPFSSLLYFFITMGAYITHSFWSFEGILDLSDTPGTALFVASLELLHRGGFWGEQTRWAFWYQNISLPGAIWYDFGFIGFVIGAILHGICLGGAYILTIKGRTGGIGLLFIISVLSISILSPMCFATQLPTYPFQVFAFIFMHYLTKMFFGQKVWLNFREKD